MQGSRGTRWGVQQEREVIRRRHAHTHLNLFLTPSTDCTQLNNTSQCNYVIMRFWSSDSYNTTDHLTQEGK